MMTILMDNHMEIEIFVRPIQGKRFVEMRKSGLHASSDYFASEVHVNVLEAIAQLVAGQDQNPGMRICRDAQHLSPPVLLL